MARIDPADGTRTEIGRTTELTGWDVTAPTAWTAGSSETLFLIDGSRDALVLMDGSTRQSVAASK